jgi:hypothetical protein
MAGQDSRLKSDRTQIRKPLEARAENDNAFCRFAEI